MKQSARAIFLHKISYSESSLITTFYSREFGLQQFLFQGGKKKSASLHPCALCELTFYNRPDSELGKLTEARTYLSLNRFVFDPIIGTLAFFIADVMRNSLKTAQSDEQLYDFLEECLININHNKDIEVGFLAVKFLVEFASHLGIEPLVESTMRRYFYLIDGSFSDVDYTGDLVRDGNAVLLIQELLKRSVQSQFNIKDKRQALEVMIRYYELHVPQFNVDKSLYVIRELFYT